MILLKLSKSMALDLDKVALVLFLNEPYLSYGRTRKQWVHLCSTCKVFHMDSIYIAIFFRLTDLREKGTEGDEYT